MYQTDDQILAPIGLIKQGLIFFIFRAGKHVTEGCYIGSYKGRKTIGSRNGRVRYATMIKALTETVRAFKVLQNQTLTLMGLITFLLLSVLL